MSMKLDSALDPLGAWRFEACAVDAAAGVIGSRSALLLLREAFYGTSRFSDFVTRTGLTASVVATRLKLLEAADIFNRRPYYERGQRTRFEYVLTVRGQGLLPVMIALIQWSGTHLQGGAGPIELVDVAGQPLLSIQLRSPTGRRLKPEDVIVKKRDVRAEDFSGPIQDQHST